MKQPLTGFLRSRRFFAIGVLLVVLPFISACSGVGSRYPLSPPKAAVVDPNIEGMWKEKGDDKNGTSYAYVVHTDQRPFETMTALGNGNGSAQLYLMFVTRTPKYSYLNLADVDTKDLTDKKTTSMWGVFNGVIGMRDAFIFRRYRYNWLGRIVVSAPDPETVAQAVEKGELKGTVDRDKSNHTVTVHLSDTSAHLLNYFESNAGLFKDEGTWIKIGGP